MKPKDSLFQLGNLDWIAAVRFQQLLQGSHQRKDNWGGDEDVQLLQELYHHLYLSYVFLHDQKMGKLLISPILHLAECNIYGVDVVESFSGPKKGVEWLWFFASTRVLIFTAERVPISGLMIICRLSCLRVPPLMCKAIGSGCARQRVTHHSTFKYALLFVPATAVKAIYVQEVKSAT